MRRYLCVPWRRSRESHPQRWYGAFSLRHGNPTVTLALCTAVALLFGTPAAATDKLEGRAVLPAATFAPGPTSGAQLGSTPINGQAVPFVNQQPVQGFSAVLDNLDGTFNVMADNGFGSLENSADFNLRVYTIRPDFKTKEGGTGAIEVGNFIELHDPDKRIPFAITNHFTPRRVLTGADFDIESMQRAADGTLWFGDEFGPFLLHTDARGKVLEAPIPLPDFDNLGKEIRSPQNPFNEESSAIRVMNAVRTHARLNGNTKAPVFSPWHVMLDDGSAASNTGDRETPPIGSGMATATSDIFNIASIQSAGYPVVTWTVNLKERMLELMALKVNGIISDRPDLLLAAVKEFDANNDGTPGDFLGADGLIDSTKFDAQGHRGARNLRPENTIPAMEVALDFLMTTLETDTGITEDGVPVLDHDPHVQAQKCRRTDGTSYELADEELVKNLTVAELQSKYICDKVFRGPEQLNDPTLSPVSLAFFGGNTDAIYMMPTVQQLFDFVEFYANYYRSGAGSVHPDAGQRWKNAEKVRFNIETKVNPRAAFASRTIPPTPFVQALANVIVANGLQERADIQSFDFRTLLVAQEQFPQIRTVYLFGDFPIFPCLDPNNCTSDDGTNLQDEFGANTPWLAGLYWPYRVTRLTQPFRAQRSGGFEGMALSSDGQALLSLLEKPLVGGEPNTLLIHDFSLATKQYGSVWHKYALDPRGRAIGDFVMFDATRGLVIERDDTQGDLTGFKTIYEIALRDAGQAVTKKVAVDLMNINDPQTLPLPGLPGDVGLGKTFAFPFVTIEDVVVFDRKHIGVLNDNNFPFSVGRHVGSKQPDDNEFIIIRLGRSLGATREGDLDGDDDVDRGDIARILSARNTAADGAEDDRDLDGDGNITALDVRKVTLLCTRPGCATE